MRRFVLVKPLLQAPTQRERDSIQSLLGAAAGEGFVPILAVRHHPLFDNFPYQCIWIPGEEFVKTSSPMTGWRDRVKRFFQTFQATTSTTELKDREPVEGIDALQAVADQIELQTGDVVFSELSPSTLIQATDTLRELGNRSPANWQFMVWTDSSTEQTVDAPSLTKLAMTVPNLCLLAESQQLAQQVQKETGLRVEVAPAWYTTTAKPQQHRAILVVGEDSEAGRLQIEQLREVGQPLDSACELVLVENASTSLGGGGVNGAMTHMPVVAPIDSVHARSLAEQVVAYHLEIFDRNCFVGEADLLGWLQSLKRCDKQCRKAYQLAVPEQATHALLSLESVGISELAAPVLQIEQLDAGAKVLSDNPFPFAASGDLATALVRVTPHAKFWNLTCVGESWGRVEIKSATLDFMHFEGDLPLSRSGVFYDNPRELSTAIHEVLSHWGHYSASGFHASSAPQLLAHRRVA